MNSTISYQFVANDLGVSIASVRNWVKCGYLKLAKVGYVYADSFGEFKRSVAGQHKLVSRANKSLLDDHDHRELSASMSEAIREGSFTNHLSELYEKGLSNSFKNKEGIYYTPKNISDDFFHVIPFSVLSANFCDPCCGTGNFIISAIDAGFNPKNIWGYDTDIIAVDIAKARVYDKTGQHANIYVADFFDDNDRKYSGLFDVIMTNPPWGKKLSKENKSFIGKMIGAGKSTDTSSLFMLASMQIVREGGIVGMLLPEAFLNVTSFKDTREKLLSHRLLQVSCYGKPFKGIMAKAKSLIVQKNYGATGLVLCKTSEGNSQRLQESFMRNPNFIINEGVNAEEDEAISRVFALPHVTLKDNAKWALGIVTGNNKRFIANEMKSGYVPVFAGKDLRVDGVLEPKSFIPDDFSMYQQVAPIDMYSAKSKIIYKFISSKLVFVHDTEGRYVLNSANVLIPSDDFKVNHGVLAEYLSSDFINWIFRSIFGTHKILRTDLEKLPIFTEILSSSDNFNEDRLINYIGLEKGKNGTFRPKK